MSAEFSTYSLSNNKTCSKIINLGRWYKNGVITNYVYCIYTISQ